MTFKSRSDAGITLVEVLVTLFIIGLTVGGVFFLISYNVTTATSIRNNYIASGLVQEGMELVRNIRDNDFIASRSFADSLPDGDYTIQWDSSTLTVTDGSNPPFLSFASTSGFYSYNSGTASIFKRLVTITTPSGKFGIEKKIVVTVSWRERAFTKSISAENHLFAWPSR